MQLSPVCRSHYLFFGLHIGFPLLSTERHEIGPFLISPRCLADFVLVLGLAVGPIPGPCVILLISEVFGCLFLPGLSVLPFSMTYHTEPKRPCVIGIHT